MLDKYVKTRSVINPYQFPSASIDVAYRAIKAQYQPALSTSPLPPPYLPPSTPVNVTFTLKGQHPTRILQIALGDSSIPDGWGRGGVVQCGSEPCR